MVAPATELQPMNDTEVLRNHGESRFEMSLDGEQVGYITYRQDQAVITLTHTVVSEGYAGRGLAGRMVRSALNDLRARDEVLIPLCPYVLAFLRRHPEDIELVPDDMRSDFDLA